MEEWKVFGWDGVPEMAAQLHCLVRFTPALGWLGRPA
jgi:hypothetical protein